MDIIIAGHRLAREFRPTGRAYAIRIFGSGGEYDADAAEPLNGEYVFTDTVRFDETRKLNEGKSGLWFDGWMAQAMIGRFLAHRERCNQLLVHCYAGEERSPAVAKALNDRFELGERVFRLSGHVPDIGAASVDCVPSRFSEFPLCDEYVYATLMKAQLG